MSERIKCPCGATNPPGDDCTGLFHDSWAYVERLRTLRRLARNLRDAAGCALAFSSGVYSAASWLSGQLDGQAAWEPNCDGVALRGWKS